MMTRDEALKYTYTQMVKNNPNEAIKNLIMYDKINYHHLKIILEAQEWINKHIARYSKSNITIIDWDESSDPRILLDILKGECNEE